MTRREAGADWQGELSGAVERTRDQIRAWIGGDTAVDQQLREVFDSMVRRDDKKIVIQLSKTLEQLQMNDDAARAVWEAYSSCETKAQRKQFAADLAERGQWP